ncbi:MAG TPA: hypothetical protein VLE99_02320 [Candidatus Saccharimonadales bacterium]|nr:hypothetical protein [Candidatus Saccharimonadales bacterium]
MNNYNLPVSGRWAGVSTVLLLLSLAAYAIRRKWPTANLQDGPLLSSEDMLGAGGLTSMNQGNIAGFKYNLLTNNSGRTMFFVELGHNSWSHIVAYGDKSGVGALVSEKFLERAELEGNFPDYFHMYCNPEAQTTLREVFAPDVMAQFADFCRAYDFEIFHDTLYLSQAQGAIDASDQTTLTTDVSNFLSQNAQVLRRL